MVKKKYSYEDIIAYRCIMKTLNVETYNPKSIIRTIIGVIIILVGIVTSLVPFSSVPCYIIGGIFLGIDILSHYKKFKKKISYECKIYKIIVMNRLKNNN